MTLTGDQAVDPTMLSSLIGRRAHPAADGLPPAPAQLAWLLRAATTVPDHGGLRPWRFVVVSGEHRERFGDALAADFGAARGETPVGVAERLRRKAFAAPTQIVLIASPDGRSNVPGWEQESSAACCGYAIVLAAQALGLGAVWKSAPLRDGLGTRSLFGLSEAERLLGWVNVGTPEIDRRDEVPAPDLASVATVLTAEGPVRFPAPG